MTQPSKFCFLGYFSRITTPGREFLPQIDGLRFVAIAGVIAFHIREICSFHFGGALDSSVGSSGFINRAFGAGSCGVQLFFAISGFILALPFAKQYLANGTPISINGYFIRRVTRLEPPYLIHLLFLFVLCALFLRRLPSHQHLYHNPDWSSYVLRHILPSSIYSNGFIFETHPYPNIVLWSLEVEVQFYLVAPLIAKIYKIKDLSFRRAIFIGFILPSSILLNFYSDTYLVRCSLVGNLQFFLIGFLVCDFYIIDCPTRKSGQYRWDLFFIAACIGIVFLHEKPVIRFCLAWLLLICLVAAFKGVFCRRFLSYRGITIIGGMCYTIYMYHLFMISLLIRPLKLLQTHSFTLDLCIQFVAMSPVIFITCALLFVVLERPFMKKDWPCRLLRFLSRGCKRAGETLNYDF